MHRVGMLMVVTGVLLTSCAPAAYRVVERDARLGPPSDLQMVSDLERTAWRVWLAMELGRLEVGRYDTSALLDLSLPRGTRWTLLALDADVYALQVDDDAGNLYVVRPGGVDDAANDDAANVR